MQDDLFRSGHDLDLRSNIQNDLLRSIYSSFDASSREKYDTGKMHAVSLLSLKLLQKNLYNKKLLLLEFFISGGQTVDLKSNLRAYQRKSGKIVINCAFEGRCSSSGSRVMCRFVEKYWKRQNLSFDLWWPLVGPGSYQDWAQGPILIDTKTGHNVFTGFIAILQWLRWPTTSFRHHVKPNWTMCISHKMLSISLTSEIGSFYHVLSYRPQWVRESTPKILAWNAAANSWFFSLFCGVHGCSQRKRREMIVRHPRRWAFMLAGIEWRGMHFTHLYNIAY